ncbi:PstS family phosphate ABC transporter substrate-binding protein [Flavobacterium hiemivividum]|uniref:Phosphate ABC transporter substrate-binding protein n=1 Tax=Flavobacterium hiemivividum TaxID=2541734 RepID=A0A4R5CWN0_9FLAO|nr:substrate-binding domain-containing protein [Flavobacterium hiemivividum]TDE02964.1 phosphate ABC transporter substrate-binding protein [Flavobacterium hiemivividum]
MINFAKQWFVVVLLMSLLFIGCKKSEENKETILKGTTTILVDETLQPLMEDQISVFQSRYKAEIVLESRSEKEVMLAFLKDTSRIALLSRKLNNEEVQYFEQLKIKPKTTKIGSDAIAFISNKNNNDTLIALKDVILFMQGKSQKGIKGLVFDNPNSSTMRYMSELAGIKEMPKEGVFSFKTNKDVVKFVSENDGMIGVVGLNWLYQPSPDMADFIKNINVLSVKGEGSQEFVAPTQNNLAEGKYPLARDLYIINCQGYSGLGMGFASFVAGDIGQRIILKAGLLPIRIPGRKVEFITKSKKENE